jgi:hypothetical protein
MSSLGQKGITFSGVSKDGPVKLAFFTDPDKNPLYLSQTQEWR